MGSPGIIEKENGNYHIILGLYYYIGVIYHIGVILGIMEKKMETTILGYIGVILGIMEKKMETTPVGSPVGFSRAFLRGFCTKRAEKKV